MKITREVERYNPILTNIIYNGKVRLSKDEELLDRSIKEIICIEDAIKVENEYAFWKFGENVKLIDVEVRNSFPNVILLILKCAIKFNHYVTRDLMINDKLTDNSCPHCNSREDWAHVV